MQRRQLLKSAGLVGMMLPLGWIPSNGLQKLEEIGLQLSTITASLVQDFPILGPESQSVTRRYFGKVPQKIYYLSLEGH